MLGYATLVGRTYTSINEQLYGLVDLDRACLGPVIPDCQRFFTLLITHGYRGVHGVELSGKPLICIVYLSVHELKSVRIG